MVVVLIETTDPMREDVKKKYFPFPSRDRWMW
jgi:hypothetical protein